MNEGAIARDLDRSGIQSRLAAGADRDAGTRSREATGHGEPYAAARTGDDNRLVRKRELHPAIPLWPRS
jgi:hypothetical protein